jgi:hypothetical protein
MPPCPPRGLVVKEVPKMINLFFLHLSIEIFTYVLKKV